MYFCHTLCVLFHFLGTSFVFTNNLTRTADLVLWFPERTINIYTYPWHQNDILVFTIPVNLTKIFHFLCYYQTNHVLLLYHYQTNHVLLLCTRFCLFIALSTYRITCYCGYHSIFIIISSSKFLSMEVVSGVGEFHRECLLFVDSLSTECCVHVCRESISRIVSVWMSE